MIYCPAMQECSGQLHTRAREGILLFNAGRYFEAHEELEAAWREERGGIRQLYQGVLEAGVTYLHLKRGNLAGAEKVYKRCMRWLTEWPEICRGLHVGQLRRDLESALLEARRLGVEHIDRLPDAYYKPLQWREAQDGDADEPT